MGASGNPNATRLSALSERKKALEDTLQKFNLELRQLCIKEAELTGVIPIEYPLEPGEKPPVFQKTGFQISQNLLNNLNGDESVSEMELELQVLAKMADAAQGLANNHNIGKTVRRHHRSEYEAIKKRYEALLEKIQFSEGSYSVATRHIPSTSNKGTNSQPKQKKKPRPTAGEHAESGHPSNSVTNVAIVPLAVATDSSSFSSFSKESPHRRSSRSLASDKNIRDSVPNLVSTPLQRAESSDAELSSAGSNGHLLLRVSRSHTADDVAVGYVSPNHPEIGYNPMPNYTDDNMTRRFGQMNARRAGYSHTIHTAPRMVYEENQRQLDSLLYRQQALAQAQTQNCVAHAQRPEHHSMYNINSSFPRQPPHIYDDHHSQQHSSTVRPHSVMVYRHHQQQQQQLQPHQLYGEQQQQQILLQQQQHQRLYWRAGTESPPQHQQLLDASSPSSTVHHGVEPASTAATPLRYGSLDRRRERPQRTFQTNAQAQNHDVQRRKKSLQGRSNVTNRCATTAANKNMDQQMHLHQQLQRTQSLGSVGIVQQLGGHHAAAAAVDDTAAAAADDIDIDVDLDLDNDDNQSSCGSEQSMKYQQMRRRRRSKEKNWYESSLDVDNSGAPTNLTVIAPEDKYGDVSVQFRQRAATMSAAHAPMSPICSTPPVVRPLSTAVQQFNYRPQTQERVNIQRPPPKQIQQQQLHHQQQPPIRPRAQQPPPPQHIQPLHTPPVAQSQPAAPQPQQQSLEIPAESRPSPSVSERVQNHTMYTSPIPKAGTTVLQVGQCKPYQEETKPFEMSDYYKYSTKHNKASPIAKPPQPSILQSPSVSTLTTLSPHLEFQHNSPNKMGQYVTSGSPAMRSIQFSPTSPSKGGQGSSPRVVPNSPRRSMNISFDMAPTQNIAENFASEMNQWYNNNNSNNNVNNNMVVISDGAAGMNGNSSPRKANATTTATLV